MQNITNHDNDNDSITNHKIIDTLLNLLLVLTLVLVWLTA